MAAPRVCRLTEGSAAASCARLGSAIEGARGAALERADIRDHRPNLGVLVLIAECRHRCEAEAVLHDPEKLRVGLALCVLAGEVGRVGVGRQAEGASPVTVGAVTYRAGARVRREAGA